MSDKKPSTDIQAGVTITPPAAGKVFPWLAERIQLTRIINAAVAWMNLSVIVKLLMPDGTTQTMPVVRPVITPNNSFLELPIDLTNFSGGGGSGSVPFSGNGAPSASTLAAGSYVAGPVPSLYVDMMTKALYVCTTAGTASTSVWVQISGGAGGSSMGIRGLWNPSSNYMTYDIVIVATGTATGMYVSMIDNNTNSPDSGVGWLQFGTTQGQWL